MSAFGPPVTILDAKVVIARRALDAARGDVRDARVALLSVVARCRPRRLAAVVDAVDAALAAAQARADLRVTLTVIGDHDATASAGADAEDAATQEHGGARAVMRDIGADTLRRFHMDLLVARRALAGLRLRDRPVARRALDACVAAEWARAEREADWELARTRLYLALAPDLGTTAMTRVDALGGRS